LILAVVALQGVWVLGRATSTARKNATELRHLTRQALDTDV
jgi:hypothetical protein